MRKVLQLLRSASLLFVLLLAAQSAFAQAATVKGTVKDANGSPLTGASITVEGQKGGTITDANGNFTIRVQPGSLTLIVSYVGQEAQRISVTVNAGETVSQDVTLTGVTDLSGVVVVGSRSRLPRSKLTTPVPVDVISTREIKQFAQVDLGQTLTYVAPSFQSARQTISDGTDHIDPAGLRGLGPDQTLVLLNGKRRHNTALVNINGTVGRGSVGTDLNAIPLAAIERIEVLRDGAAAQYGSDAIAGVINIVLKKNFNGLSISGMAGQNFTNMPYNGGTKINDGLNRQVDFTWGATSKKGHYLTLSGQWLKRDRSNRSGLDNIPLVYIGNAGNFPTGPGSVSATDYRRWLIDMDKAMVASRGYDRRNIVAGNSGSENVGGFLNAGLNLSERAEIYVTIGASSRNGIASGFSRNPNSMSQQPVLANGQRYYYDGFLPEIHSLINDYSVIGGTRFNLYNWDIDLSYTRGSNGFTFYVENTGNASLAPTDEVQTKFNAGKLRFVQGTANLDISRRFKLSEGRTLNVAYGAEYRREIYRIVAGEPNSYLNGGRLANIDPIQPYPGTNQYVTFAPVNAVPGAQVFPGFQPTDAVRAKRDITSAYLDLEWSLGRALIGGAVRYEKYSEENDIDYDNLGGKLTGRLDVSKNVSLRASLNTGFRAPSLHQRYFQNTSTQFVGGLPSQALTVNNNNAIVRTAFGIDQLLPEKSRSATIGLAGRLGNNLTYTVDAYFIRIEDRIVLSTQFNRSNPLVATILNSNGVDASITALQFWTNAVNTETKGLDIVITNRFRMGNGNAMLSAAANFNHNSVVGPLKTNSVIDDPVNNPSLSDATKNPANDLSTALFDRQQRSRIEVAQPRNKINLTFGYDLRKWNFQVRTVRFGEVQYIHNVDPASRSAAGVYWNDVGLGTDQTFDARWSTDVVVTWRPVGGLSISVGANNVFDIYPERVFVDPRNDPSAVYGNPVQSALGTEKSLGGYSAARDASNRGRFLFNANQFGFNGRFLFARLAVDVGELKKVLKP
ncbi:MAG TPA: TonB-dependent receptor [Chitinophagaceae bacterium]|nr:TonB-dependent receptor [Chitinophagaceae bacterium]